MKVVSFPFSPFTFELNQMRFEVDLLSVLEVEHGKHPDMPLPHYVYLLKVSRIDIEGTEPITFELHGSFHEWARGKPAFSKVRAINAFADYVIDAAIYLTRKPEDLLEAYAMDSDMANKTWLGFKRCKDELMQRFRMTSEQIIMLANVFQKLQIDGRLKELIPGDGNGVSTKPHEVILFLKEY